MYFPKFKLFHDATEHIGDRLDSVVEITDTALKKKISDIMGLTVTYAVLLPEHQLLYCTYKDDPSLIFEFSEDNIYGCYTNIPLTPGSVLTVGEELIGNIYIAPSYEVGQELYDMTWGAATITVE